MKDDVCGKGLSMPSFLGYQKVVQSSALSHEAESVAYLFLIGKPVNIQHLFLPHVPRFDYIMIYGLIFSIHL